MGWITEIKIDYNEKNDCYTYKFEEINSNNEKQTTLSRQFTHWDDCVELLHDKIMCWMQENKCVENWDEDCAEERFNFTDYYEGPKDKPLNRKLPELPSEIRYDIFPELEVEVDA
tara:strand:+ start:19 stop:363 length:345 start_codon:yes stop_codon:yes gene_type:complete